MHRRTLLKTGIAATAGGLLPATEALTSAATAAPRANRILARGLQVPWGLTFLPNGDALVGERETARVFRVRRSGGKVLVGKVPDVEGDAPGEGGLLGLAVSPDFADDRLLYAYVTTASGDQVVRMRYADGGLGAPEPLLTGIPTATNHHGGRLMFGPAGLLYATTGDAAQPNLAQDKASLAGKILRMTADGGVPPDNPFDNHVFSYGHRNVEGIARDGRGRLWAAEFGADRLDELNHVVKGGNYGWPHTEGPDGPGGHRDPLVSWRTENCSPSGVAVARGRAWVGALRGEALWAVNLSGPRRGRKTRYFHRRFGRIRTVENAPDGSLWITTSNRDGRNPDGPSPGDDKVVRITLG